MSDDIHKTVAIHDKVLFGDRENLKDYPGVIAEQSRMSMAQDRTNEILTEVRNALLGVFGLIVTGFVTALVVLVFKQ